LKGPLPFLAGVMREKPQEKLALAKPETGRFFSSIFHTLISSKIKDVKPHIKC